MKDGQQIRFNGEGDQEPGLEPGDIIIVLDEKPHERFERHGIDLVSPMEISLTEALCGLKRTIKTLDDRFLVISTEPGKDYFGLTSVSQIFVCCHNVRPER